MGGHWPTPAILSGAAGGSFSPFPSARQGKVTSAFFVGVICLSARSRFLVGRRERHFCDSAAGQSYVRALRTSGIARLRTSKRVAGGNLHVAFLALGEPRRVSAIVSTTPQKK